MIYVLAAALSSTRLFISNIDCALELIGCQIKCQGKIKRWTGHLLDLWMEPGKIHIGNINLKHWGTYVFVTSIFTENLWKLPRSCVQNATFMEKCHENTLFITVSHGCKGINLLCNHESWLQRRNLFDQVLTSEKQYFTINFAKKCKHNFSLIKVNSQSVKFNLDQESVLLLDWVVELHPEGSATSRAIPYSFYDYLKNFLHSVLLFQIISFMCKLSNDPYHIPLVNKFSF